MNPWRPMTRPIDLKHLGKLAEEGLGLVDALDDAASNGGLSPANLLAELAEVTGKINREWLEDELADVAANVRLVVEHFHLDQGRMNERVARKMGQLRTWHAMLDDGGA